MNEEITIYELLGLIKDGKAPKKIKYKDAVYNWGYDCYTLSPESTPEVQSSCSLFNTYRIDYCLNDKVEIIDGDFEDIEIIKLKDDRIIIKYNSDEELHYMTTNKKDRDIYIAKINQLIRNQQKLIDVVNELAKDKE